MKLSLLIVIVAIGYSCKQTLKEGSTNENKKPKTPIAGTFGDDLSFLKTHSDIVTLQSGDGLVAVSPTLQGRVMTSTAKGMEGASYGWINKAHYESKDTLPQINVYGGEERFWLGPEGGQYSFFFKKDVDFTYENWYTPRLIDVEPFEIKEQTPDQVSFEKTATLTNYSGFTFDFKIDRNVNVLSKKETSDALGIFMPEGIHSVGYRTTNTLTNIGNEDWKKETGLPSIWLLGMLKHSETTTVVIPYTQGNEAELGSIVNDDYFGKVPSDRLVVTDKAIFFKGDGKQRGKIGLSPQRAKNIMGSYDAMAKALTIVTYNKPKGVTDYVNSKWELQEEPYKGDVINSYNDGPSEPGARPLGPFYELESSSPAAALKKGETITHIQSTYHFEGSEELLNQIAQQLLGVSLNEIIKIFKQK